jgi:hypothetical protein
VDNIVEVTLSQDANAPNKEINYTENTPRPEFNSDECDAASNPNRLDDITDGTSSPDKALNRETNSTESTVQPKSNDGTSESPSEENVGCNIYCEEGLEILQQRYIRIHGLCFLPRGNCLAVLDKDRCLNCYHTLNDDHVVEEEGNSVEPLKCQVGQYMIVRLPPNCQVQWKKHQDATFHFREPPNQWKYHSRDSSLEKLIRVSFFFRTSLSSGSSGFYF